MSKWAICFLMLVTGTVNGQVPQLAGGAVFCGAKPLLVQGITVPVRATFKRNRHQYLPRTMGQLLRSNAIQTVMLGDSIVGDTFGPQYAASGWHRGTAWGVEPLAELYRSSIYSVVSVLGSTGAWYYRQPGNVQTYVLDSLPDLVMIGGISNRDDIDAIRDVVLQIRAARPQTEFILMTGAVNLQSVPVGSSLLLAEAGSTYESRLARLADELGTGFINMRGSYDEFVFEANRLRPEINQAYFQRDPIHANDYGRAVLREIITMFFRPAVECPDRAVVRQHVPTPQAMTLTAVQAASNSNSGVAVATPDLQAQVTTVADTVIASADTDVDKSGIPDHVELLASAAGDSDRLRIAFDPSVSSPVSIMTLSLNLLGGLKFLVTDLDQDGLQDLVVGTAAGVPYLYVYINTGIVAQPFFDPVLLAKSNAASCTVDLVALDVNADRKPDLFAANGCAADSGSVDYYQLDERVLEFARQLPESYQTDMSISSIHAGGSSVQHLGPSLQIVGTRNNQVTSMELGVAQPAVTVSAPAPAPAPAPEPTPTPAQVLGGGGAIGGFELLLCALGMVVGSRKVKKATSRRCACE